VAKEPSAKGERERGAKKEGKRKKRRGGRRKGGRGKEGQTTGGRERRNRGRPRAARASVPGKASPEEIQKTGGTLKKLKRNSHLGRKGLTRMRKAKMGTKRRHTTPRLRPGAA